MSDLVVRNNNTPAIDNKNNLFNLELYYTATEEQLKELLPLFNCDMVGWFDNIVEFPNVKLEKILGNENGNQVVQHDRYDGEIFQEGKPMTAENFGLMEFNTKMLFLYIKMLEDQINELTLKVMPLLNEKLIDGSDKFIYRSAKKINEDLIIIEGYYDEQNGRGVV